MRVSGRHSPATSSSKSTPVPAGCFAEERGLLHQPGIESRFLVSSPIPIELSAVAKSENFLKKKHVLLRRNIVVVFDTSDLTYRSRWQFATDRNWEHETLVVEDDNTELRHASKIEDVRC
jgi:hypothetical protein